METLSFAFGAFAMIGLLMAILIVAGVVKVIKHGRQLEDMERAMYEQIDYTIRHTHEVEKNMHLTINSQITDAVTQCNSYTDKRIDKIIDSKKLLTEEKQK